MDSPAVFSVAFLLATTLFALSFWGSKNAVLCHAWLAYLVCWLLYGFIQHGDATQFGGIATLITLTFGLAPLCSAKSLGEF